MPGIALSAPKPCTKPSQFSDRKALFGPILQVKELEAEANLLARGLTGRRRWSRISSLGIWL